MASLAELKTKLEKTKILLEKLEERFALGEISKARYRQLSTKYNAEAENLRMQITEKELSQEVEPKPKVEHKQEVQKSLEIKKEQRLPAPKNIMLVALVFGVLLLGYFVLVPYLKTTFEANEIFPGGLIPAEIIATPKPWAPQANIAVSIDSSTDMVTLQHRGGDAVTLRDIQIILKQGGCCTMIFITTTNSNRFGAGGVLKIYTNPGITNNLILNDVVINKAEISAIDSIYDIISNVVVEVQVTYVPAGKVISYTTVMPAKTSNTITPSVTPSITSSTFTLVADKKTLAVGETWDIGGGYTLAAWSIDAKASPRQVWLALSRNGVKIDDKVLSVGKSYTYNNILKTEISGIYGGATSDIVELRDTYVAR